jgi:lysozyme
MAWQPGQVTMKYSLKGIQLTEAFEADGGPKLSAYLDQVGRPTIAYGHTAGVKLGDCCTREQAEAMLHADIAWAEAFVNNIVTKILTQGEFDALVDFTFNLGSGNFQSSTLLKLVNEGDMEDAAKQFEQWDHAGGKVVAGLLRRRKAEEAEFKS